MAVASIVTPSDIAMGEGVDDDVLVLCGRVRVAHRQDVIQRPGLGARFFECGPVCQFRQCGPCGRGAPMRSSARVARLVPPFSASLSSCCARSSRLARRLARFGRLRNNGGPRKLVQATTDPRSLSPPTPTSAQTQISWPPRHRECHPEHHRPSSPPKFRPTTTCDVRIHRHAASVAERDQETAPGLLSI